MAAHMRYFGRVLAAHMRYFGRVLNPQWTDLAVVVGPDVQWTEHDYEDLQRFRPEVLMGYSVRLMTARDFDYRIRGLRPAKIVILDAVYSPQDQRSLNDAMMSLNVALPELNPRVERWYVHRALGIERVA